jgi:hypothetical protein
MQVLTQRVSYYCPVLTEFKISRQILVKMPNVKFYENSFSVARVVTR